MKALMYLLVAVLAIFNERLTAVSRLNDSVTEARAAYARHDFSTAIFYYRYLLDSLHVRDRAVKLNLAHAYFKQNIPQQALKYYQPLATKTPLDVSSQVNLQLGVLAAPQDKTEALGYFKKALVQNTLNEEARYNYELLQKYLVLHPEEAEENIPPAAASSDPDQKKEEAETAGKKENPPGDTEAETPDFDNQDPENSPPPGGVDRENPANISPADKNQSLPPTANENPEIPASGAPGDTKGAQDQEAYTPPANQPRGGREESDEQNKNRQTTYERLRAANLSPEKARMLLEALREAEVQYLQQLPRQNTRKTDASKPDW